MDAVFAPKSDPKKKPSSAPVPSGDRFSPEAALDAGATAGMPLFLQRSPTGSSAPPLNPSTLLGRALLQRQIAVNEPGDAAEAEADRLADRATTSAIAPPHPPAATATPSTPNPLTPADAGIPLSSTVRQTVEPLLGHDLSHVRVHADASAQAAATQLQAKAFTHQNHIWLGPNQSQDDTALLAHETTHVVQQAQGRSPTSGNTQAPVIQRKGVSGASSPAIAAADTEEASLSAPTPALDGEASSKLSASLIAPPSPDQAIAPKDKADDKAAQGKDAKDKDSKDKDGKEKDGKEKDKDGKEKDGAEKSGAKGKGGKGKGAKGGDAGEMADDSAAADTELGDLATGDLALIDRELAEHQRWAGALGKVGTAGSEQRAGFITEAVGSGLLGGAAAGAGMGLGMGLAGRGITKLAEKGATKLAAKAAVKLGTQAAKFTPLPGVGAMIGGAMSAYALYERDWAATGATIGRFGKGSSDYEMLANSIAAVSEVIDVCTNVLNVIAGVIGAISVVMWIITVLTVGIASPLAATLSSIAVAIGTVTTILDTVNAAILQPCVVLFRALHTFTSEADPREVEENGGKIATAAGASGGALGGYAGGKAAHVGGAKPPATQQHEPTPHPDHPVPPTTGDGPAIHVEAPPAHVDATGKPAGAIDTPTAPISTVEVPNAAATIDAPTAPVSKAEAPGVATVEAIAPTKSASATNEPSSQVTDTSSTPKTNEPSVAPGHPDETSFASLEPQMEALRQSKFAEMLDYQPPPSPAAPPGTTHSAYTREHRRGAQGFRDNNPMAPGTQAQHWTKRIESEAANLHPDSMNQNMSALQSRKALPAETLLTDPAGKGTIYVPDTILPAPTPQLSLPGMEPTPIHTTTDPVSAYSTEHKFADRFLIRAEAAKIQNANHTADPGNVALWAGASARWRMTGHPGQGNWGPQPAPLGGTQLPLPGFAPFVTKTPIAHPTSSPNQLALPFDRPSTPSSPAQLSFNFDRPSSPPPSTSSGSLPPAAAPATSTPSSPVSGSSLTGSSATPAPAIPATPATPPVSSIPIPTSTPTAQTVHPSKTASIPPSASLSALNAPVPPSAAGQLGRMFLPQLFGQSGGGKGPSLTEQAAAHQAKFTADNQLVPTPKMQPVAPIHPALKAISPVGAFAAKAGQEAAAGFNFARQQPQVERVNPNYPPPPGTPQQQVELQNEIEQLLAARAQTEQVEAQMNQQQQSHQAKQAPLQEAEKKMDSGVTATQAHQQAVANKQQRNQEQQQRQQESQGLVSGYPSKKTGMEVLRVPLKGFEAFTSIAGILPNWPSAARKAKRGLNKMNADAKQFLAALNQVDSSMDGQQKSQPAKQQALTNDGTRLQTTNQQADTSQQTFQQGKEGTQALQQVNTQKQAEAAQNKSEATAQKQELTTAADERKQAAKTLAEQMQAWAIAHKEARKVAIVQTQKRLQEQGYIIRNVQEK